MTGPSPTSSTGTPDVACTGVTTAGRGVAVARPDVTRCELSAAGDRARLHGLQVLVSDPQAAARDARAAAFADARDRAEQFAALAGRGLGELLELTETPGRGTPVGRAFKPMAAEAAMPVDAGTEEIEAHVTTTWAWA